MKTLQTINFRQTQEIGEAFAHLLQGGDVICLRGDLGAGKTTFMQGLAKGLGIKHRIISPTFIIVRKYEVPNVSVIGTGTVSKKLADLGEKQSNLGREIAGLSLTSRSPKQAALPIKRLYHIDLYRTETRGDLEGVGLPEILQEKDALIAIEWSEKLGSLLPEKRWELEFEWISENERKITIEN